MADDVALRTLIDRGPRSLETDGTLQLILHVEPLVHRGRSGERPSSCLSLSCLAGLLPFIFLLFHLGKEQAELVSVFLQGFLPDRLVVMELLILG